MNTLTAPFSLRLPFARKGTAARASTRAQAEHYFAARARHVVPGQAKAILERAGKNNPPRQGD